MVRKDRKMGKAEKRTKEEKDGNSGKSETRIWIVEADPW